MKNDVIIGIVYSKYDEIAGPEAFFWVPGDLTRNVLQAVSSKTLNLIAGDESATLKDLEIISFPSIEMDGLIKFVHIVDASKRGGFVNATIAIVFNEKDASIFYKFHAEFVAPVESFASQIQSLEEQKADARQYIEIFNKFNEEISTTIKELFEKEIGLSDGVEFPEVDEGAGYRTYKFKVIVVGDPEVGKTSTILRYTDNAFRRTYIMTMGVNVSSKNLIYNDRKVKFAIWDIAGQAKFQLMRSHFYEGADGVIFVFDLTRPDTLVNIERWHEDITKTLKMEVVGIIIGNKADLVDQIAVTNDDIEQMSIKLGLGYIETSALQNRNISEAFTYLAAMLVNKGHESDSD
ncbi:MAG TPA: Rab family GTPase [Candidatus Lokiarchaeia archaeon]|nr:Rab family GTPase [Candidatus Lokiarchaeia archaeon]